MNTNYQKELIKIAEVLNSHNILWGVGASVLLYQYSIANSPNDIDIIISTNDIEKADKLLSQLGEKREREKSDLYRTDYFYEYQINGIELDVMSGFKIKKDNAIFEYLFDEESIPNRFTMEGICIPFMTLEDWFVLYQLIPNRDHKVTAIELYLKATNVQHTSLLEKMLKSSTLSENIKIRIRNLLYS